MAVEPISVLLNTYEKREAYEYLLIHFDEIIPYVGAGLSNYCKRWGEPFKIIYNKVKANGERKDIFFYALLGEAQQARANSILKDFGVTNDVRCIKDCLEIAWGVISQESSDDLSFFVLPDVYNDNADQVIWDSIHLLYDKEFYLELGEMLNIISYINSGKKFDLLFFNEINKLREKAQKTISDEIKKIDSLKYLGNTNSLPTAIWYLPYFGKSSKYVFTTNTDSSLKDVYREVGIDTIAFTGKSIEQDISENEGNHHIIFHIHGYQNESSYNSSNTFVMTWLDYKKAYVDGEGSSQKMLMRAFKDGHFLFIGASLKKDTTVSLMKKQANLDYAINRHVALMAGDRVKDEDANELIISMATQVIHTPHWNMYPTILCNLTREKHLKEWSVYKDIINGGVIGEKDKLDDLVVEMNDFLSDDAYYLTFPRKLKEDDVSNKLYPILKDLLIENNTRSFEWSVCRVNSQQFDFPIKVSNVPHLDTYSAPLGNTIYIIGGSKCTDKQIDELEQSIKLWTEQHANMYWATPVKVRVFFVDCVEGLSPNEIIGQLFDILRKKEDRDTAAKQLFELLQRMYSYDTYSEMLRFKSLEETLSFIMDLGLESTIRFIIACMSVNEIFQKYKVQLKDLQEEILTRRCSNELEEIKTLRLVHGRKETKEEDDYE